MLMLKKLKLVAAVCFALAVVLGGTAIVAPSTANHVAAGTKVSDKIPEPYKSLLDPLIAKYAQQGDQLRIVFKEKSWKNSALIEITNANGKYIAIYGVHKKYRNPQVFTGGVYLQAYGQFYTLERFSFRLS